MNKAELVAAIAEKTELSKKDSEKALKAFIDVVNWNKNMTEGGTRARLSRQPKGRGTRKGWEADEGKAADGRWLPDAQNCREVSNQRTEGWRCEAESIERDGKLFQDMQGFNVAMTRFPSRAEKHRGEPRRRDWISTQWTKQKHSIVCMYWRRVCHERWPRPATCD